MLCYGLACSIHSASDRHLTKNGREADVSAPARYTKGEASAWKAWARDAKIRDNNLTWIGEYATLYTVHQAY